VKASPLIGPSRSLARHIGLVAMMGDVHRKILRGLGEGLR